MQEKGRNKEPKVGYVKEQKTSDTGCLPQLWHKGIQNRESLNTL
jgi:hypothetical protein